MSEVVAARYRESLTLAEVGRAVDCSPFHPSRLVTAVTGVPIHRMIVRRRLRDALEWLLETRESVSFIAHAVGFGSYSRLTEAFRREYGAPPSTVRRTFTARSAGAALPESPGRSMSATRNAMTSLAVCGLPARVRSLPAPGG